MAVVVSAATESDFDAFVRDHGERLRRVLVAQHGLDEGCELAAEAIGFAFEHWERVSAMANPAGYLYRVAQNTGRKRGRRWRRPAPYGERDVPGPAVRLDPELAAALAELRPAHRASVVLVHGFGWSYAEAAEALGVPETTIRNHVHRGLVALRRRLGPREEPT